MLSVGSRAYTGTTTTRKVIKLIKWVLQSEESKNEGRFKTTYNSLHNAGRWSYTRASNLKVRRQEKRWKVKSTNNILHKAESRAYTGTTTTRKVIKLIKRAYNPKKVGTKEGLKQPTTPCITKIFNDLGLYNSENI